MSEQVHAIDALHLALALLENGESLLGDAVVLLEAGRPTRAGALSLIAMEELGKIYLCLGGITGEGEIPSATSREWRDHRDKLETARALELAFVDVQPDFDMTTVKAEVDWQLRAKMLALYVDHDNGITRRPADLEADAHALIDRGRAKSSFLHGILDRITPDVLTAMKQHGELMSRIAQALIDEQEPEATVERLRTVTAAAVSDDEDALRVALIRATTPPALA